MTGPSDTLHQLIVQRPVSKSSPRAPVGRSTRGCCALDVASGSLVFLKDYWRPLDSTRPSEADIYAALAELHIPHLPHVHVAGDVPQDGNRYQCTLSQKWKTMEGMHALEALRRHRHHRIVQDVAYPLTSVRNSRELVSALRDTIQCKSVVSIMLKSSKTVAPGILSAYGSHWLHRDISVSNIMLDEDGNGIVNDWDHAVPLDPEHPEIDQRTVRSFSLVHLTKYTYSCIQGTWQFLSVRLAERPDRVHRVQDDVESCFWVLLYAALRLFECNSDSVHFEMFDECVMFPGRGLTGGGSKKLFVIEHDDALVFTCQPLRDLLDRIRYRLGSYYLERKIQGQDPEDEIFTSFIPDILGFFDSALSRTDWPEADLKEEQREAEPQGRRRHRHSSSSSTSSSADSNSAPHEPVPPPQTSRKRRTYEDRGDDSEARRKGASKRKKTDSRINFEDTAAPSQASRKKKAPQRASSSNTFRPVTRSQTRPATRMRLARERTA